MTISPVIGVLRVLLCRRLKMATKFSTFQTIQ